MTIEIRKQSNDVVVIVNGRLDTITAPVLEKTLAENIGTTKCLILDFKGLEYISSAGLRVLLGAQKKIQNSGAMKLTNVCNDVMEILEMTGFADILNIE